MWPAAPPTTAPLKQPFASTPGAEAIAPVQPTTRKGFGHFVTDQMVTRALNATVELDLAPDGPRWSLQMPASEARGGR
jgi:hypothetical protein